MKNRSLLFLAFLALLFFTCQLSGQESVQQILAGKRTELTFPIPDLPAGVVEFRVQYDGRILASGQATRTIVNGREVAMMEITVTESLKAPLQTEVKFECDGKKQTAALMLFPTKPFQHSRDFLSRANIQLFDPQGDTAKVFETHDIPFEQAKDIASVSDGTKLLVIGENCDQFADTEFATALLDYASRSNVLCLMPANANIDLKLASHQILIGNSVSDVYDVNLQGFVEPSTSWRPNRKGDFLQLEAVDASRGWSWIKILKSHGQSQTSIAMTGLPLIEMHNENPAARHVLFQLIEHHAKPNPE